MEYLDQILSSRCVFAPSSLYAPTFWFILKTKTQVRAFFFFQPQSTCLRIPPKALVSSFVSCGNSLSFYRITNSLLPTLSLLHRHGTSRHLLQRSLALFQYHRWVSNPQSCESNCWDFLFWSLSMCLKLNDCTEVWANFWKLPSTVNYPSLIFCFPVMIFFSVLYPVCYLDISFILSLQQGILSLTVNTI